MIELVPSGDDDLAFLELAQRIVNGAVAALQVRELYLVHIDNWFDHKWLGWWSEWSNWKEKELREPCVPPFNPNRVRSETHFTRDANHSRWASDDQGKTLHVRQPGRRHTHKHPLDRVASSAAFLWYSGNTATNRAGSMMLYLSGAEGYAWYASFTKKTRWQFDSGFRITRRELVSFEECGRRMEPART